VPCRASRRRAAGGGSILPRRYDRTDVAARIIERHGRLPGDLRGEILPSALFRYRRTYEPPRVDEGFSAVELVHFEVEHDAVEQRLRAHARAAVRIADFLHGLFVDVRSHDLLGDARIVGRFVHQVERALVVAPPLRQQRRLAEARRGLHQDDGKVAQLFVVGLQSRAHHLMARHTRWRDTQEQVVGCAGGRASRVCRHETSLNSHW
jgi:hypothetical protein